MITSRVCVVAMIAATLVAATAASGSARQTMPAAVGQDAESPDSGSVLDRVFSLSQARRGEQRFNKVCASCHSARDFVGRKFAGSRGGTTLGDLALLLSETMPESAPGSLAPEEYASIIAFFLRESGYPEGEHDLPSDLPALMKIWIEPAAT